MSEITVVLSSSIFYLMISSCLVTFLKALASLLLTVDLILQVLALAKENELVSSNLLLIILRFSLGNSADLMSLNKSSNG